jgi:Erv1 / Alr family
MTWKNLHQRSIQAQKPEDLVSAMDAEWQSLMCSKCRVHMQKYMEEHPPKEAIGPDFFRYTFDYHNDVNRITGAPEMTDIEVARAQYSLKPLQNASPGFFTYAAAYCGLSLKRYYSVAS